MMYIQTCFSKLFQTVCCFFNNGRKIPSLQGMAAKKPYVGHSSKYSSCIGLSLGNQRHLWLTNLNFTPLQNQKTTWMPVVPISIFLLLCCLHAFYDPIYPRLSGLCMFSNILWVCLHKKCWLRGKIITPVYRRICKCVTQLLPAFGNWVAKFDHFIFHCYSVIKIIYFYFSWFFLIIERFIEFQNGLGWKES